MKIKPISIVALLALAGTLLFSACGPAQKPEPQSKPVPLLETFQVPDNLKPWIHDDLFQGSFNSTASISTDNELTDFDKPIQNQGGILGETVILDYFWDIDSMKTLPGKCQYIEKAGFVAIDPKNRTPSDPIGARWCYENINGVSVVYKPSLNNHCNYETPGILDCTDYYFPDYSNKVSLSFRLDENSKTLSFTYKGSSVSPDERREFQNFLDYEKTNFVLPVKIDPGSNYMFPLP